MQVASLNLTDPQQNCPSPWVMETTPGRSCAAASPPCASVYFDTFGLMYQKICGMALGYASSSPDGFFRYVGDDGIDGAYLDGVSITHGQPHQHIWSLTAGHGGNYRCPCDNTDQNQAPPPPSFVGNNYFCDGDYMEHCGMVKAAPLPAAPSTILRGLQPHFLLLLQTALRPGSATTKMLVMNVFFLILFLCLYSR